MGYESIYLAVIIFIGFLISTFLKRLKIDIKHPWIFSITLWGIGAITLFFGIKLHDTHLAFVGFIILLVGGSLLAYRTYSAKPKKRISGTTATEKFVESATTRILHKFFGK